jgi:hypothetical protein
MPSALVQSGTGEEEILASDDDEDEDNMDNECFNRPSQ